MAAMAGLKDGGHVAINEAFDTAKLYSGPYIQNAPDLIIGFNDGYRTSWDGATDARHATYMERTAQEIGGGALAVVLTWQSHAAQGARFDWSTLATRRREGRSVPVR